MDMRKYYETEFESSSSEGEGHNDFNERKASYYERKLKRLLKNTRQKLKRNSNHLTESEKQNKDKDKEITELKKVINILRCKNTYKSKLERNEIKFRNILKEKDFKILRLEEDLKKIREDLEAKYRLDQEISDCFQVLSNEWCQTLFTTSAYDINRVNATNESLAIHEEEESLSNDVQQYKPMVSDISDSSEDGISISSEMTSDNEPNSEQITETLQEFGIRNSGIRNRLSEVLTANQIISYLEQLSLRSETIEDNVVQLDDNNYNDNSVIISTVINSSTTMQVAVFEESTIDYSPPVLSEELNFAQRIEDVIPVDNIIAKAYMSKHDRIRTVRKNVKSPLTSDQTAGKKRKSNLLLENKIKKRKTCWKVAEKEPNKEAKTATNLVLIKTENTNIYSKSDANCQKNAPRKLPYIDLSVDSDMPVEEMDEETDVTENNSIPLKHDVVSGVNVSRIATSNVHLSDSNEDYYSMNEYRPMNIRTRYMTRSASNKKKNMHKNNK